MCLLVSFNVVSPKEIASNLFLIISSYSDYTT